MPVLTGRRSIASVSTSATFLDSAVIDFTYDVGLNTLEATIVPGSINSSHLATGAVTNTNIASGTITADRLAFAISSGGGGPIADFSITSLQINTFAVTEPKMGNTSVFSRAIGSGQVGQFHIVSGAIGTNQLAALSVIGSKIDSGAVTGPKIADFAVTNTKIASLTIQAGQLGDFSVTSAKLATPAVGSGHIFAGAVQSQHIQSHAIQSWHINTFAIGGPHIQSFAVTGTKINTYAVDGNFHIALLSIGNVSMAAAAIAADNIQSFSIQSWHVSTRAIQASHINTSAVQLRHIAAGAIDRFRIQDAEVLSNHVASFTIHGYHINTNQITFGKIAGNAINEFMLRDASVFSNHVASLSIHNFHLASGAVGDSKLQDFSIRSNHINTAAIQTWHIADSAIKTANIGLEAVLGFNIAFDTIFTANLQNFAITSSKINSGAVTLTKLQQFPGLTFLANTQAGSSAPVHAPISSLALQMMAASTQSGLQAVIALTPNDLVAPPLHPHLPRNMLDNIEFLYWRRGTSFVFSNGNRGNVADRWSFNNFSHGTQPPIVVERADITEAESGFLSVCRITAAQTGTLGTAVRLRQIIDTAFISLGARHRLRGRFRCSTSFVATVQFSTFLFAGASVTGAVSRFSTLGNSWQNFDSSGVFSIGYPASSQVGVDFVLFAGTTLPTSVSFFVQFAQLEISSYNTALERRAFQNEIPQLRSWYDFSYSSGSLPGTTSSFLGAFQAPIDGNGRLAYYVPFPDAMRIPPTVTIYSPLSGTVARAFNSVNSLEEVVAVSNVSQRGFFVTAATSMTANGIAAFHWVADTGLITP